MSRNVRDTILFLAGLAGLAYETLATGGERPTLIIAFLGMCGAPVFLRTDEAQSAKVVAKTKDKEKDQGTPDVDAD